MNSADIYQSKFKTNYNPRQLFCRALAAILLALALTSTFQVSAQQPGTIRWQFPTQGEIHSTPAVGADGTIYFGSWDTRLYALNRNGTKKWEFLTGNRINSSSAIGPDGTIYVGSDDTKLYAIAPDGTKKWEYATGNVVASDPAVGVDGTIYIVSDDGNLYALNSNGSKKWQFATGGHVPSAALGTNGTIYVGSTTGFLNALNADGSLLWKYKNPASFSRPPVSSSVIDADGTILTFGRGYEALRPDGTLKVSILNQFGDVLLVIGQGGILYGSYGPKLGAVFSNGNVKWTFPANSFLDREISGAPAIAQDGTVYFAVGGIPAGTIGSTGGIGTLYAVSADGKEKWQAKAGGLNFTSPTIATDGTIYIGSDDKNLYAIYGGSGLADAAWPTYRRDNRHTAAFLNPPLAQTELSLAMYPGITVKGNVGNSYRIEFSTDTGDPKNWQPLATVTLDRTPYFFVDVNAGNQTKRFYRAVLLP